MKFITLTDKASGKKFDAQISQIKMLEDVDGGTHLIFGGDMGRVVIESRAAIYSALGVSPGQILVANPSALIAKK